MTCRWSSSGPTRRIVAAIGISVSLALFALSLSATGSESMEAGSPQWADDLSPIAPSDWSYARAAHLIERAGFGATPEEIAPPRRR